VVIGLLILANMAVTARDQLQLLVLFSIAALVLLIRAHSFEEQVTWMRRRIGDPAAVSALYLRGGGSFIAAAVIAALILTATASSAPLQGLWADVPQRLIGFSQWLQEYVPNGGEPRPLGVVGFGSSATTQGLWQPTDAVAFEAKLAPTEQGLFKWRAGTYAVYDGVARWSWGASGAIERAPDTGLLTGTGDDPTLLAGRREFRATITPGAYDGVDPVEQVQSHVWVSPYYEDDLEELRDKRDEVEARLALGLPSTDAARPYVRAALRTAVSPSRSTRSIASASAAGRSAAGR